MTGIFLAFDVVAATYTVTNIAETTGTTNRDSQINAAGVATWVSYDQSTDINTLIYYDTTTGVVEEITPVTYPDYNPISLRINIQGDLTWIGNDGVHEQIYYYNRETKTVTQLTNDSKLKTSLDIGDGGEAVWSASEGYYGGIFHYSESQGTVVQLTNSDRIEHHLAINVHGDIVWETYFSDEIRLYSAASGSITQINPNNGFGGTLPRINDRGDVLWSSGQDGQLELYDAVV